MLGRITRRALLEEYGSNCIPNYYNPDLLPHLTTEQVIFYDEMHVKQEGGTLFHNQEQIRFHRDTSGKYNPTSTTLGPKSAITTFKYAGQARFCLGVTKVRLLDGTTEGKRCKVFDYTSKQILTIQDYDKRIDDEIRRVKGLSSNHLQWVTNN